MSDENRLKGSRVKVFVGREGYTSSGEMAGFVPTGVIVVCKVLLTAESPQDVAHAEPPCRVTPAGSGGGDQGHIFISIGAMCVNVPFGLAGQNCRAVV